LRKCEEYIRKQQLPVVLNKKTWRQNGVYELLFHYWRESQRFNALGKELTDIIMDLKQLLSMQNKIMPSIRTKSDHGDQLYDYIHDEETSLPTSSLKAEKISMKRACWRKMKFCFETADCQRTERGI